MFIKYIFINNKLINKIFFFQKNKKITTELQINPEADAFFTNLN